MFARSLAAIRNLFVRQEPVDLSYSRIRTFEFCPWKYALLYERNWREPPHRDSCMGLSLHRALDRFHVSGARTLEDLIACLDEAWVDDGFRDPADSCEYYERARRILTAYFDAWQGDKSEIVWTEKKFSFAADGYRMQGIIDRIDRTPAGEYEVLDYKTKASAADKQRDVCSLQLGIYCFACERAFGFTPARSSIYSLATGERITREYRRVDRERIRAFLSRIARAIRVKNYYPNRASCPACLLRSQCAHTRHTPQDGASA